MRYEYKDFQLVLTSDTIKINQKFDPTTRQLFRDEKEALKWGKQYMTNNYGRKFYEATFKITTKKDEEVDKIEKNKKYKVTVTRDEKITSEVCYLVVNQKRYELEFEEGEAEVFVKFQDSENVLDIEERGDYIMFMQMEKVIAE